METNLKISEPEKNKDYFPCLFTNKNNTIVILAEERTSDKTFSGIPKAPTFSIKRMLKDSNEIRQRCHFGKFCAHIFYYIQFYIECCKLNKL